MLQSREVLEDTIKNFGTHGFAECFKLADLGCSSGPNSFLFITTIVNIVHAVCQKKNLKMPDEFQVFLNDLPNNDFNALFKMTPSFSSVLESEKGLEKIVNCFISGVAGSFYTRLFPSKSLHFVHSSTSVHWLSQVPANLLDYNKGNIYMAKSSPRCVYEAYFSQFEKDFTTFLRMRSEEVIPNGRMVLSLVGRSSADHTMKDSCYMYGLLGKSLLDMSAEGILHEEDITSFNLPYYATCTEELEAIIGSEGSFSLDRFETSEVNWDIREEDEIMESGESSGEFIAKTIRAITESMLASDFGDTFIDEIFESIYAYDENRSRQIEWSEVDKIYRFILKEINKDFIVKSTGCWGCLWQPADCITFSGQWICTSDDLQFLFADLKRGAESSEIDLHGGSERHVRHNALDAFLQQRVENIQNKADLNGYVYQGNHSYVSGPRDRKIKHFFAILVSSSMIHWYHVVTNSHQAQGM
ncbi:hypothetical protein ACET3Z_010341 [Daucus carota]